MPLTRLQALAATVRRHPSNLTKDPVDVQETVLEVLAAIERVDDHGPEAHAHALVEGVRRLDRLVHRRRLGRRDEQHLRPAAVAQHLERSHRLFVDRSGGHDVDQARRCLQER